MLSLCNFIHVRPRCALALTALIVLSATSRVALAQPASRARAPQQTLPQRAAPSELDRRPQYGPIGPQITVKSIEISGNKSVREGRVRSYLQTRVDRTFDPEVLQQDVRRLTASGLFRDVRTYTREVDGGIAITYEVLERPLIQYIKIIGNETYADEFLAEKSGLKAGDALNIYNTGAAAAKIQDQYNKKGYRKARVTVLEGDKVGDQGVVFSVHEGPKVRIWDVDFAGNEVVTSGRLKTQIKSKPSPIKIGLFKGTFDPAQLDEDLEKLTAYYRRLGYFHARVGREIQYSDDGQ
ncbi:MAG: hypothetical protein KDA41_17510, partial [Planctomycetales bacterium]|nr:hypothetical protein [Planctomycetales bacterium]